MCRLCDTTANKRLGTYSFSFSVGRIRMMIKFLQQSSPMALDQDSVTQSETYQPCPLLGSANAAYACYARSFAQAWGFSQSVLMSRLSWFMTAYLDVKFVLIRRPIMLLASDKYGSKRKEFKRGWTCSGRDRDPSQLSSGGN